MLGNVGQAGVVARGAGGWYQPARTRGRSASGLSEGPNGAAVAASENDIDDAVEVEVEDVDASLEDDEASLGDDELEEPEEFDEDAVDLEGDDVEAEPELEDGFDDGDDLDEALTADPALLATFDGDDEDAPIVALVEDDDEDGDGDGVREGEFVCRSCFMAMRMSALADPKAMLCRDCA